jgi:hypothetical protein
MMKISCVALASFFALATALAQDAVSSAVGIGAEMGVTF